MTKQLFAKPPQSPKTPSFTAYELSNGFHYIYQEYPKGQSTSTIHILCKAGSLYETVEQHGIAHLLEHLLFTVPLSHPVKNTTTLNILRFFDETGATLHAFTTIPYTIYTITCLTKFLHDTLQILSHILLDRKTLFQSIPVKDCERECNVLREEMAYEHADVKNITYDVVRTHLYDQSASTNEIHPLLHTKRKELLAFYMKYYTPEHIYCSIVTSIAWSSVHKTIVQSLFGKTTRNNNNNNTTTTLISNEKRIYPREFQYMPTIKPNESTSYIIMGFPICGLEDIDGTHTFLFVRYMLNRLNGRLFTILRQRHGLAYQFYCEIESDQTNGYFSLNVHTIPTNVLLQKTPTKSVLHILMKLYQNILTNGFTTKEIDETKEYIRNMLLIKQQEGTQDVAEYNAFLLMSHTDGRRRRPKVIPHKDLYKTHYNNMTNERILHYMRQYIRIPVRMMLAITGRAPPTRDEVERVCLAQPPYPQSEYRKE